MKLLQKKFISRKFLHKKKEESVENSECQHFFFNFEEIDQKRIREENKLVFTKITKKFQITHSVC